MRFRGCRNVLAAAAAVAPHRKPISRWHKCTFHLRSQRTHTIHLYNTVYYTFEDKQTHALYSATLCTLLDWSKVYLVCAVGACAFAQMSSTTTTTAYPYIIIQRETRSRTTTLFYIHYGVTLVQWQCWRIAQTHVNCQMILLVQPTDRTPYVNDNETAISFYPTKSVNKFFSHFCCFALPSTGWSTVHAHGLLKDMMMRMQSVCSARRNSMPSLMQYSCGLRLTRRIRCTSTLRLAFTFPFSWR